eukprot:3272462-Prorocentrum_lima.AAC.1
MIEHSLRSILGALMWIALRTRPDTCWAVTRVSRAAKTGESQHEVDENKTNENPNQTYTTVPCNDMEL